MNAPKQLDDSSSLTLPGASTSGAIGVLPIDPAPDPVVLIHGLGGNQLCMLPLKWALQRSGFDCVIWNYASFRGSIESHGIALRRFLQTQMNRFCRVHFVAHSLGSIIVRSAFGSSPPDNLGRTVFLAPPNHGSPAADLVSRMLGCRCQILEGLSSRSDSEVNRLPVWGESELGIIASKYDAVVPLKSVLLENHSDLAVVQARHAGLLISKEAMRLTASFLKSGRFERAKRSG